MSVIQNIRRFLKHPHSRAIGLVFLVSSWGFGSWVINIPYIKHQLDLNESTLGLVLFGPPLGQIFTNYLAPRFIQRWGLYNICIGSSFALAFTIIFPVFAPSSFFLFLALFLFGINYALLNISMNTIASLLSTHLRYPIISTCHAMWSIGGMLGTLFAGLVFAIGVSSPHHILIAAAIAVIAILWIKNTLLEVPDLNQRRQKTRSSMALTPKLLLITVMGILMMVAEGFAFDWSAVFLRDYRNASEAYAAFGFSAFMLTMTTGRLIGDTLMESYAPKMILLVGGIIAVMGLIIAIYSNTIWFGYLGLAFLGLGVSLNAPILYGLSMKLPNIPAEVGLATFATFSFVGFLAGPPLIGWFAQRYGLETSMMGVAIGLFVAVLLSRKL